MDNLNDRMAKHLDLLYDELYDHEDDHIANIVNQTLMDFCERAKDSLEEVYGDI